MVRAVKSKDSKTFTGMKGSLNLLLRTSRPIVWLWFAFPFLTAAVLSGARLNDPLLWVEFIALGPFYSLVVYGLNDIYDYESDVENPRKGEGKSQGEALKPENHGLVLKASAASSVLLMAVALATGDIVNILGMSLLIVLAAAYSVPPVRVKERPVLDSILNGLGYVLIPAIIGYSFGGPVTEFPVAGAWVAFAISGMHAAFAVMDYKPDKKAGVTTIAIRLGPRKTILFSIAAVGLTLLFSPLESFIPNLLLFELLLLVSCIGLDVYEILEFKKSLRDKALAFIYLEGLVLVTFFLLRSREIV
jgi:4-hydroxybenzoate polyprenyltransferase